MQSFGVMTLEVNEYELRARPFGTSAMQPLSDQPAGMDGAGNRAGLTKRESVEEPPQFSLALAAHAFPHRLASRSVVLDAPLRITESQ
jgi:hypothetical protein